MNQQSSSRKLVVFDVEGVLFPKNRYLAFELGENLSFLQFLKLLLIGLLYELRLLPLDKAMRRIFMLFRNLNERELLEVLEKVPLLPYAEAVFSEIREQGFKTALISSGLPQVVVEDLAQRLKADHAAGLELETQNNLLTGRISGDVIGKEGKAAALGKIMRREGLTSEEFVVVADDRNNAPIFYEDALKIGYNPDFLIAFKSDFVVRESLRELPPLLESPQRRVSRSLARNDVIREAIHASGVLMPLVAIAAGVYQVALLLSLTALIYTASELARITRRTVPVVSAITLNAATFPERHEFATAPIFFALAITLSLLAFPTPASFAAIAILSLGDSVASLVGKHLGQTLIPYNKGKNLEGSVAGFACAFLGAALFVNPSLALAGAFAGLLVESLPLPVNDNLSIPLVAGTLMTLLS
jgi:HAD superfamily phosphoserine phosphatase-like hydrolase